MDKEDRSTSSPSFIVPPKSTKSPAPSEHHLAGKQQELSSNSCSSSFMFLPPKSPGPRTKSPAESHFGKQELNAVIEALMGAQTRARESERMVTEYDAKLLHAVQRIQEYVDEARKEVLLQLEKVNALEAEKKEASKDTTAESFVVASIEKSLLTAREQLTIDEMEFERRKALLQHLEQFLDPIVVWRSGSFDGQELKEQIEQRNSTELGTLPRPVPHRSNSSGSLVPSSEPASSTVQAIVSSRSLDQIHPHNTAPIAPRPSAPMAPIISVVEPVECHDPLKLAMKKIAELESRIEQAERRALDAEEARVCSELRLQQLIELLENERDTARDMRAVLHKQVDPQHALVLPRIDQRLQLLHAECNKIVVTVVKWMLSWFVPIADY